jgi:hypothetical protein
MPFVVSLAEKKMKYESDHVLKLLIDMHILKDITLCYKHMVVIFS